MKAAAVALATLALLGGATAGAQEGAPSPEPAPSSSPEASPVPSRAEEWRRERLARRERLSPYRPTLLERQILAFEKAERPSILDLNYKGLWPTVASVSSGSRLAPGVRFWQPDIGGGPLSVHASAAYSLAGYELYDLQVGRIPHRGRRLPPRSTRGDDVYELGTLQKSTLAGLVLYGSARYRHNAADRFFGLGPSSRASNRTLFRQQDAVYEIVAGWQLTPRLAVVARAGYLQVDVGPGEDEEFPPTEALFTDASAPGLRAQPDFWKTSLTVFFDGRDEPFNPHRGGMVAASATRFDDRAGGAYRFDRYAVDARGYVSLGSVQRVLALRAYTSLDHAAGGARVPFYLQEALSNSHTLRGFDSFRFRGEGLVSLQAEYRWEAVPALELALFLDAGRVFDEAAGWGLRDLETGRGFGIRLKTTEATLVRFDLGWSREGARVYLRFGTAF